MEQGHPAIRSSATFEMVQMEIARCKQEDRRYSGVSIFSGKIKCGECGGFFGAKVWHSTDKYRRIIYRGNNKYDGHKCQTPHVTEEEITAFNQLVTEREEIIANAEVVRQTICDTLELEQEKNTLQQELAMLVEMTEKAVMQNARIAQDQKDYQRNYNSLVERYEVTKAQFDEVTKAISAKESQAERLAMFERMLKDHAEPVAKFDSQLWASMVECVRMGVDKELTVVFRNGMEIKE